MLDETDIPSRSGTDSVFRPGQAIARMAARQHGVVSLAQLRTIGMAGSTVRNHVMRGTLHRIHRGVYAVGHPLLTIDGRRMAATLATRGAPISNASAVAMWEIGPAAGRRIDVLKRARSAHAIPGLRIHLTSDLRECDVTEIHGIPCTSLPRSLLDWAATARVEQLVRAIERAESLRIFDLTAVEEVLARSRRRRGTAKMRAALAAIDPLSARTRSELEKAFIRIWRRARLPLPEVNVLLEAANQRYEVDFMWRGPRLVAEVDGWQHHGSRLAFARDRRRDRLLALGGWHVVRFTWHEVRYERLEVAGTLRVLLEARRRTDFVP